MGDRDGRCFGCQVRFTFLGVRKLRRAARVLGGLGTCHFGNCCWRMAGFFRNGMGSSHYFANLGASTLLSVEAPKLAKQRGVLYCVLNRPTGVASEC